MFINASSGLLTIIYALTDLIEFIFQAFYYLFLFSAQFPDLLEPVNSCFEQKHFRNQLSLPVQQEMSERQSLQLAGKQNRAITS